MQEVQKRIAETCSLAVVTCIDWRLHGIQLGINYWVNKLFGEEGGPEVRFDPITSDGCFDCFTHEGRDEGEESRQVIRKLGISVGLHHPESFLLIPHMNCGKILGRGHEFKSVDDEAQFLIENTRYMAELLQKAFPTVQMLGALAYIQGADISDMRRFKISSSFIPVSRDSGLGVEIPPAAVSHERRCARPE